MCFKEAHTQKKSKVASKINNKKGGEISDILVVVEVTIRLLENSRVQIYERLGLI